MVVSVGVGAAVVRRLRSVGTSGACSLRPALLELAVVHNNFVEIENEETQEISGRMFSDGER